MDKGENDHAPSAADDVPFKFMGHHAFIAKKCNSGLSERTERAGISSIKRISCIKENEFKSCRINNSQGRRNT